ncbi:MAG: hypothetical protein NMK33_02760 [Candidatus Cardinium sp.]|nr:hypothetical protein [Cardinium endosymbiont of Dermatophagoides farinae]UWW97457.1 MAG: hypothetical protein NMK33_02760 [Candidatus Cardinium sp.]
MRKINALPIGYSDVERVIRTGYYVNKTKYAQGLSASKRRRCLDQT